MVGIFTLVRGQNCGCFLHYLMFKIVDFFHISFSFKILCLFYN